MLSRKVFSCQKSFRQNHHRNRSRINNQIPRIFQNQFEIRNQKTRKSLGNKRKCRNPKLLKKISPQKENARSQKHQNRLQRHLRAQPSPQKKNSNRTHPKQRRRQIKAAFRLTYSVQQESGSLPVRRHAPKKLWQLHQNNSRTDSADKTAHHRLRNKIDNSVCPHKKKHAKPQGNKKRYNRDNAGCRGILKADSHSGNHPSNNGSGRRVNTEYKTRAGTYKSKN